MNDPVHGSVLVTGASTPVGRALIAALRGEPAAREVIAVDAAKSEPAPASSSGTAPALRGGASSAGVRHVRADLTSRRGVRDLLFGEHARGVDTIVHGVLSLDPLAHDERVRALNVESTRELLDAAEDHPSLRRFVFRSHASVYRVAGDEPTLIDETEEVDFSPDAPAGQRSRVEADVMVGTRVASSRLRIAVLRCAEVLAPDSGSQLYDYLSSRVCLRPLGYDPMVNVLSLPDAARALALAVASSATGIFNIPGRDSLPLSELIHAARRLGVPLPGPLLTPLYRMRAALTAGRFRYALHESRFHYGAILSGNRAAHTLQYAPEHPLQLEALFG